MLNQQIGNYKFHFVLGEGGMATVYLAENTMLDSLVAIKVLKEEFVHNKNVRTRFLDEAKKMVKVKHPNIIQVLDLIDSIDIVAIVMEYIEGQSLKDLIEKQGKISQSEIKRLFPQIIEALQRVHTAGFVHRDIKPSNFMLGKDGTIKLADFGIAKDKNAVGVTETGTQMGTPLYMSPEQIKSTKDVDHRSDIYSLGVVLYEMVTGYYPFDNNTLSIPEIQVCILRDPLPSTHTFWDDYIIKATAKIEAERFQSCEEWLSIFKIAKPAQKSKSTKSNTTAKNRNNKNDKTRLENSNQEETILESNSFKIDNNFEEESITFLTYFRENKLFLISILILIIRSIIHIRLDYTSDLIIALVGILWGVRLIILGFKIVRKRGFEYGIRIYHKRLIIIGILTILVFVAFKR